MQMPPDPFPEKAAEPQSCSLAQLLDQVNQIVIGYFEEANPVNGLTLRQYFLLEAIDGHPGSSQTTLIGLTGIDRSTLADLVSRLTVKGLVERVRSETDGRANCVSLTPTGQDVVLAARPAARAADVRLLDLLSGSKRAGFVAALERLRQRSRAHPLDAVLGEEVLAEETAKRVGFKPKSKSKSKKKKKKQAERARKLARNLLPD